MLVGDFQYCSSSSEASDSELDSDCSTKSDEECIDKLLAEKRNIEQNIQTYEKKLKSVQKRLRSLNDERNSLLSLKNKLICSANIENDSVTNEHPELLVTEQAVFSNNTAATEDSTCRSSILDEPLRLDVTKSNNTNDEEEFDSEDDL